MAITGVFDAVIAYQFVKMLSQPFDEWKAYELGIIDENGKTLRKRNTLKTQEEKNSFTTFHVMVRNLKLIMSKLPGGKSKLMSFAAALYLLKEDREDVLGQEQLQEKLQGIINTSEFKLNYIEFTAKEDYLKEEMSAATTTGDVAMVDRPMDFAGSKVFKVPTATFMKARMGKKKYDKWYNYVGEADNAEEIRSYGLKNPKNAVILQDSSSGAMMYLRYGKR
jgi:hypothetical protein